MGKEAQRIALLILSLTFSAPALAIDASLALDGGALTSRVSLRSEGFTLSSKNGTHARAELSFGFSRIDLVARGEMNSYKFSAPSSRVLVGDELQATSYSAAIRLKTSFAWLHAGYQNRALVALTEAPANVYTIEKVTLPIGLIGVKFPGFGNSYRMTFDVEAGTPLGKGTMAAGSEVTYGLMYRGLARIEFGSQFRIGFAIGQEVQEYQSPSSNYEMTDFTAGLTLAIGAGKKSSGASYDYYSITPPQYPF